MRHILKCENCKKYLITQKCLCGGKAVNPKPQKYSPEDAYGKYRRIAKKEELKKEGLV